MEETIEKTVEKKDILRHYFASLLVYGLILFGMYICPIYYDQIGENPINYITFFTIYYFCYMIFAPVIYFNFKPKSLLESKNITILKYIKRQFTKKDNVKDFLSLFFLYFLFAFLLFCMFQD